MIWTLVGVAAAAGTAWLAILVARVRREIPPTRDALDRLARGLRPALLELRTQTARVADDARLRRGV